ncbi:alpha/beta hydrolase fold domain-containing protein [Thetidibacter halocola]|uniref:Alpha/beta hydrolase fold domain-containing protein n=1 Tax=Thetidibacter halocola TaxID=2827239 RepID=A0A8J7WDD5_9RHOB|nr:alpha/beta hydrolase fold domain-containing protein [Thetidibacter halocola]MBS0125530.1 alpha/beta hydrolase fold domain-containing protein [Thetidibacter halocola]
MSVRLWLLNLWLRTWEKPFLRRADDPVRLRKSFETKARLYFHGPSLPRRWEHLDGVPALRVGPQRPGGAAILYFHGGGYVFGSPLTHAAMLARLSKDTGLPAILPHYRLAPEHPHPAAIEDAVKAYRAQVAQGPVILGGDSAGGGLALALLAEILAQDLPTPLGVFAFSPLTDLGFSGASVTANVQSDVVLPVERIGDAARMFLDGQDPLDPRASPLFADFFGAPPVWLTASDTEFLLDDTRRMAARLRARGVTVTERIERDHPHVWPIFHAVLPEARATLRDLAAWITSLAPRSADS